MSRIARPLARRSVSALFLAGGLLLAGKVLGQTPPPPPALVFSNQTVQVQGMTPGGMVVWFGVLKVVQEYAPVLSQQVEVATADALGQSTLSITPFVPQVSIWVAVDLKTGAFTFGGPPGSPPQQIALAPLGLSIGGGAAPDQLVDAADFIEVLLVRPGIGAWTKTVGSGGVGDESNPSDAALKVSIGNLDPLAMGGAAAPVAPLKVNAGDLLFVVHPRTMEIAIQVVGGLS
jgi:hypothetical protein